VDVEKVFLFKKNKNGIYIRRIKKGIRNPGI
jgi:hypothetical protein